MTLKKILQKFDRFDPSSDCLVMAGSGGRFSFYAPDKFSTELESAEALPDHVTAAMVFAYLLAHQAENEKVLRGLMEQALEWIHQD